MNKYSLIKDNIMATRQLDSFEAGELLNQGEELKVLINNLLAQIEKSDFVNSIGHKLTSLKDYQALASRLK